MKLSVENVVKEYPSPGGALRVLRGVSLGLSPGETLAVTGPSGAGKSTLLNIIGSLDKPTSGSVRLGDIDVPSLDGEGLADYRSRRVGFVFQDHHLLPQCTALENVLLPTLACKRAPGEAEACARDLLRRVGLSDRADAFPARLSGGERQRVAVARALVNRPSLLLGDEPTGNLDHDSAAGVVSLFLDLVREARTTFIMVTHNLELSRRLDRCAELRDGTLRRLAP